MTASARLRRIPLVVWAGLALLIGTFVGAGYGLHTPGSTSAKADAPASASPVRAVCFGHVDVKEGVTPLYPTQPGRVVAIHVQENDQVTKNRPLFAVDDRHARDLCKQADADVTAAELQLEQARSLIKQHRLAILAQESLVKARLAEAEVEQKKAGITRRQADKGVVDEELAKAAEAGVRAHQEAANAEQQKLNALKEQKPEMEEKKAEMDLVAKKARRDTANLAVEECIVRAPVDGMILRLNVTVGETLGANPQRPALLFCSAGPRYVRAEVPQEFANRVTLDQDAVIEDDTRTGQKWSGKVVRLSDWYSHRRSMLLEPLEFNDVRTLEALVEINAGSPLRIGQRVRVTLEGNQ